ncbi:hypothetical protein NERG_01387 [Nematocida ausubeli]|uniref:Uncharacterized protein n=1 Tax=Nematocida ausubeli (strain ATCC PRA-371 / ERTm2) TaxID=1913371 RepID=H8ZCE4_NEMA1|nr:hypothetical protein NERG_01387 [Nematocida ausubeli]
MARPRREKQQIKQTGHALALSQEILAGLRRNSHLQVSMDDDSMENIDAYWNMANKELEEMERKQYEDISLLEPSCSPLNISTPNETTVMAKVDPEASSISSSHIIRRSFDDEFQDSLQNVVLTGFSDSDEDLPNSARDTKESPEAIKAQSSEISTLKTVRTTRGKSRRTGAFAESADPIEMSSISMDSEINQETSLRKRRKSTKTMQTALVRKLLYKEWDKTSTNVLEFSVDGMNLQTTYIGPYTCRKIQSNCIYYIVKGCVIVRDPSAPAQISEEFVYRNNPITGRRLKAGSVFNSAINSAVYNPCAQGCTIMQFNALKDK